MNTLAFVDIPKQTILSTENTIGDCWRCCIAAILGLPAADVPHFMQGENGKSNPECDADTQRWLNERGYRMVYVPTLGGRESFRYPCYSEDVEQTGWPYVICAGPTSRSKGIGKHHAVVYCGNQMVYDPHPDNTGLTCITETYLIFKSL